MPSVSNAPARLPSTPNTTNRGMLPRSTTSVISFALSVQPTLRMTSGATAGPAHRALRAHLADHELAVAAAAGQRVRRVIAGGRVALRLVGRRLELDSGRAGDREQRGEPGNAWQRAAVRGHR